MNRKTADRQAKRRARHNAIMEALRDSEPMTAEQIAALTGLWIVAVKSDLDNVHSGLVALGFLKRVGNAYAWS